jgi:nucleoside-diphosphate-sugar epimerase
MKKVLITGATGQIGTELTVALRDRYGNGNVITAGHRRDFDPEMAESGPSCRLDVRDAAALLAVVREHRVDTIFHLASLLSTVVEEMPQLAWDINMNGLLNVLEIACSRNCSVFFPSSIGAFGPLTPPEDTPQDTIQHPRTMYGVTKVSGELLCDYYHIRFGLDTRGVRFPGLISYKTPPGGGTTDYTVEIFHAALISQHFDCPLKEDTRLDMMYMPDAINATAIAILDSPEGERLLRRLRTRSNRLRKGLSSLGLETIQGEHPIVPVMIRNTGRTAALVKHLFDNIVSVTGLNYPVVPKGDEEVRLQVCASQTEQDIAYVLQVLRGR